MGLRELAGRSTPLIANANSIIFCIFGLIAFLPAIGGLVTGQISVGRALAFAGMGLLFFGFAWLTQAMARLGRKVAEAEEQLKSTNVR